MSLSLAFAGMPRPVGGKLHFTQKAERCYNEIGAPETKIKGILNILVLTPRAKISDPVLGLVVITPPRIHSTLLSEFVKFFLG